MECFKTTLAGVVLVVLLLQQAPVLRANDPDPLQDFCVADLDSEVTVNGYPCKPTPAAGDEFLFSSRLATGGDVNANPNGSNVTQLDVAGWPGVNTLGVSMNRIDFAPGGTNPPHEVAGQLRLLGGPDHPQERPAGGEEAASELLRLGGAEGREAAEGDVGDGARRLGVQPLHAGVLRVEQVKRPVAPSPAGSGTHGPMARAFHWVDNPAKT
uniref:Cupin type-1 domain-containing protein n=1 Tax=Oryza barthii TaxID=65489 RepID=A0A0D3FMQ4_9ORYZ